MKRRPLILLLLAAGCHDWASLSSTYRTGIGSVDGSPSDDAIDPMDVDAMPMPDAIEGLDAMPGPIVFSEDFETLPVGTTWKTGATHGNWTCLADAGATIYLDADSFSHDLYVSSPASSTSGPNLSLIVTAETFGDLDLTLRINTILQTRAPVTAPEDVTWIIWHLSDASHYYYFIPKIGGWELGKVSGTTRTILASGTSPTYILNNWYLVRVRQVGSVIWIWIDGRFVATATDSAAPYLTGSVGIAQQDTHTRLDDVTLRQP